MKKLTKEESINQFNDIHGDKYDYSLVEYIGNVIKIKIICQEHGIFEQIPKDHKRGLGCCKCNGLEKTTQVIVKEFKKIHGNKYDYSLVSYNGSKINVDIICLEHGLFKQKPNHHLSGSGCSKCGGTNKLNLEEILKQFKNIHGNMYNYSLVEYFGDTTKVKIICKKHGIFEQAPGSHKQKKGCPKCKFSKGESDVLFILNNENITLEHQKKFDDCINASHLLFDFYLPEYNCCIEINGRQHYESVDFFGGKNEFLKTIKRDNIKIEYCKNNNISLIILWKDNYKIDKWNFTDLFENTNEKIIKIYNKNFNYVSSIEYNLKNK